MEKLYRLIMFVASGLKKCCCWFMAGEAISIGDEALFGPYCVVVSSNHQRVNRSYRFGKPDQKPIHVENGVWVGAHATVLAGSHIGAGSLVAAGAVTNHRYDENSLIGGVPAKVIKKIIDQNDA